MLPCEEPLAHPMEPPEHSLPSGHPMLEKHVLLCGLWLLRCTSHLLLPPAKDPSLLNLPEQRSDRTLGHAGTTATSTSAHIPPSSCITQAQPHHGCAGAGTCCVSLAGICWKRSHACQK